jgi:hypothetical protein
MSVDISVCKEFIRRLHDNVCINSTLHMNNSNASGNRVRERDINHTHYGHGKGETYTYFNGVL